MAVTSDALKHALFRKHNFIISCNIHRIPLRTQNLYMFFPTENTCVCIYVFIHKCILLNWNTMEQERQAQKLLGKV